MILELLFYLDQKGPDGLYHPKPMAQKTPKEILAGALVVVRLEGGRFEYFSTSLQLQDHRGNPREFPVIPRFGKVYGPFEEAEALPEIWAIIKNMLQQVDLQGALAEGFGVVPV